MEHRLCWDTKNCQLATNFLFQAVATLDNLGSLANGVGWSAERARGRWRTRLARQTKRMTSSTFVPLKSYFEFKVTEDFEPFIETIGTVAEY